VSLEGCGHYSGINLKKRHEPICSPLVKRLALPVKVVAPALELALLSVRFQESTATQIVSR